MRYLTRFLFAILFLSASTIWGCKKHNIKVLSGVYEGTMDASYHLRTVYNKHTVYATSVVVSVVGNDSIKIGSKTFLYNNDKEYESHSGHSHFKASFEGRRKLTIENKVEGLTYSSREKFEGTK